MILNLSTLGSLGLVPFLLSNVPTFSILLSIVIIFSLTGWITWYLWKDYQLKLIMIRKEIRKQKMSMKVDYYELSELYKDKGTLSQLDQEFQTVFRDTFGA